MEVGRVFDGTSTMKTVELKNENQVLDSLWIPSSCSSFHGSGSMVNFKDVEISERPFIPQMVKEENGDEDEPGCHQPEKKRRLLPNQVQFLEKSFEVENKLEPERKVQLAKELGLSPRQVAIWFQNRRARYKTKQLEKDFDSLKTSYDKLKAQYDDVLKKNEELKNEVHLLKEKSLLREKGKPCEQTSPRDNAEETKQPTLRPLPPISGSNAATLLALKQEDASSAKSDLSDSDSPYCIDTIHSLRLDPADSSQVMELEASDFSQDEDDELSRSLLHPMCFPKLEVENFDDLQPNSCNLGFPIESQGTWFWPY